MFGSNRRVGLARSCADSSYVEPMTDIPAPRPLSERLEELSQLESKLIRDLGAVMVPGGSWKVDEMILASVKRSLGLARGFRMMIEDENFTCAAPLVRLQLDCALRLGALSMVADPEAFAAAMMTGEKMDKWKSDNGQRMTDRYLVNRLKPTMPWVEGTYNDACEFVHLSSRFLHNSIARLDEEKRMVYYFISAQDPARDGEAKYYQAVEAFRRSFIIASEFGLIYLRDRKTKLEAVVSNQPDC